MSRLACRPPRLLAVLLGGSLFAQVPLDWREAHERGYRGVSTMAYDAARERTVFCNRGTWEWNGRRWAQAGLPLPADVLPQAMTYDRARRRCVMVANRLLGASYSFETWEWDGSGWTARTTANTPLARSIPALAYDPVRARVVLCGGGFQDTWEYDGTDWQQVVVGSGPSSRAASRMVYDLLRQRMVLFGGETRWLVPGGIAIVHFDDTWEYDGTAWTQVAQGLPTARSGHELVYDMQRQRIVMHGGLPGTGDDTWEWDGTAWTATITAGLPGPRGWCAMVFDEVRGRIVRANGNWANAAVTDTWELDQSGMWFRMEPESAPSPRLMTGMAHDSARARTVMFGGVLHADTWEWDGLRWARSAAAPGPTPRYDFAIAYDSARQRVVLNGGRDGQVFFDETWEFDGANWLLRAQTSNSAAATYGGRMAYDEMRQRCVYANGRTFEWDGTAWIPRGPGAPSLSFSAMAYDAARQRTVLFGGYPGTETWTYDGNTWTRRQPTASPPGMLSVDMAYDRARRMVVAVGMLPTTVVDTWLWDGVNWTPQVTASRPSPRNAVAIAYDSTNDQILLFSGNVADTWILDRGSPATVGDLGNGCGASSPPSLHGTNPYFANEGFAIELRTATGGAPCFFLASTSTQPTPVGAGCVSWLRNPVTVGIGVTNASGVAWNHLDVPPRAALRGLSLYWQGAVIEPAGPFGGLSLTQGRRTTVGD